MSTTSFIGPLTGVCRDTAGNPIARRVVAWREDTGEKAAETASSEASGIYSFPALAPVPHTIAMIPEESDMRNPPRLSGMTPPGVVVDTVEAILSQARKAMNTYRATGSVAGFPTPHPSWAGAATYTPPWTYAWAAVNDGSVMQLAKISLEVAQELQTALKGTNALPGSWPGWDTTCFYDANYGYFLTVQNSWLDLNSDRGTLDI